MGPEMWLLILTGLGLAGEAVRLTWLARFPACPDFLLGMVVLAALTRRPPAGAMAGFVLGALRDFLYGGALGVETAALTVVGWGVSSLGKAIYREAAMTQATMMVLGGLTRGVIVYLASTRGDFTGLGLYILRAALPSAILTAGLVTVAFHFVPQSRPRRLSEREKKLLLEQQ